MKFVCIFFHVLNICRTFEFLVSQGNVGYGEASNVEWVLWQISYAFQQCKGFENRLSFDKVTKSLKVETFFETQCILYVTLVGQQHEVNE